MFNRTIAIDTYRDPETEVRIVVREILFSTSIRDQFIEYERDINLLWQYFRRVGFRSLIRKVVSRISEAKRNRKEAFCGIGVTVEVSPNQKFKVGDSVVFFAPNHSKKHANICINEDFIELISSESLCSTELFPEELERYVGWSPYSGIFVDKGEVQKGLQKIRGASKPKSSVEKLPTSFITRVSSSHSAHDLSETKLDAVLFGYGNYAKTQIIPYVKKYLRLSCVHEVDPDQLSIKYDKGLVLDTSPTPRDDEKYDAWFVSGYHHTHTDIAVKAMGQGAYAIIEKPLATTKQQFLKLENAIRACGDKSLFFSCFHKRYLIFNSWCRIDLRVSDTEPLDMNCLVYEIPLPALHWYNWPNSGSRLISNGCHWIDHFMFLNHYSPMVDFGIYPSKSKDVSVFLSLKNGAHMTFNVTDRGSSRLGVRELIEIRSDNASIRIIDASKYEAENRSRVIRKASVNPMKVYSLMYSEICKKIISGMAGDSIESLRSTEATLILERELDSRQ